MKNKGLKITIEVAELASCQIKRDGKVVKWEDLAHADQIHTVNTLAQFYLLFYKNVKAEENGDNENNKRDR